jgi:putative ABC transport system substrate-binding protein
MFNSNADKIAHAALQHALPTIAEERPYVAAGMLASYGHDVPASTRIIGSSIDRILRGARPGDLAIAQPTKFEFVVNLKTAKALGLTIPQPLLLRADEVIQ